MKTSSSIANQAVKKKVGILGAGQLGKMLALAGARWDLDLFLLDKVEDFPGAPYAKYFRKGDFTNYEDVLHFGREVDVISIEIENVNTEALRQLELEGKTVHPSPAVLEIIKDKAKQKGFYRLHSLPTCYFELFPDADSIKRAVAQQQLKLPFVQKARTEGYDGRGVKVVHSTEDLKDLLQTPSIIEEKVSIQKEIAVITARNEKGEIKSYDPVEMVFSEKANLVDYLFAPASIQPIIAKQATEIAESIIEHLNMCGLLAVEFFLTTNGELLINEVAPRTHNSGHHTIESTVTSQFEQQLRSILNLPLGSTKLLSPAAMVNLLGEPGSHGKPIYEGLDELLSMPGVHLHLYGKKESRPDRKMGHVSITAKTVEVLKELTNQVKSNIKVKGKNESINSI